MKEEYLEILVEELSMEIYLNGVLPDLLPKGYILHQNCNIRTHEGKSHLQKSIPKKTRAYKRFPWPVRLIVIQDQDSNDCKVLKAKLENLVRENNEEIPLLIRIACRELENWYLGDLTAVESIYPESKASRFARKAKYRNPDQLQGAKEMAKMSGNFSKTLCARGISQYMNILDNRSTSFNHFVSGLHKFLQ